MAVDQCIILIMNSESVVLLFFPAHVILAEECSGSDGLNSCASDTGEPRTTYEIASVQARSRNDFCS